MASMITKICEQVSNMFTKTRKPITEINPIILYAGSSNRPGLSAKEIASNIITRQSEAGAPVGTNTDGSRNVAEAMEVIRVEEILKALKLTGKIEIVIPAGGINTIGTGGNAGGPVVVNSSNILPVKGVGILR